MSLILLANIIPRVSQETSNSKLRARVWAGCGVTEPTGTMTPPEKHWPAAYRPAGETGYQDDEQRQLARCASEHAADPMPRGSLRQKRLGAMKGRCMIAPGPDDSGAPAALKSNASRRAEALPALARTPASYSTEALRFGTARSFRSKAASPFIPICYSLNCKFCNERNFPSRFLRSQTEQLHSRQQLQIGIG